MKKRALKEPENSEELMDMIAFVENARTLGMIKLNDRIKVGLLLKRPLTRDYSRNKVYWFILANSHTEFSWKL